MSFYGSRTEVIAETVNITNNPDGETIIADDDNQTLSLNPVHNSDAEIAGLKYDKYGRILSYAPSLLQVKDDGDGHLTFEIAKQEVEQ